MLQLEVVAQGIYECGDFGREVFEGEKNCCGTYWVYVGVGADDGEREAEVPSIMLCAEGSNRFGSDQNFEFDLWFGTCAGIGNLIDIDFCIRSYQPGESS